MIRLYCAIAEGTPVTVELKSGQPISGKISWTRDHHAGVAFDRPIDVIDILSSTMDGPRPRMPRIEIDCFATLRDGANVLRVRACDISQGGVKIECETLLPQGTDVIVTLPGLPVPSRDRLLDRRRLYRDHLQPAVASGRTGGLVAGPARDPAQRQLSLRSCLRRSSVARREAPHPLFAEASFLCRQRALQSGALEIGRDPRPRSRDMTEQLVGIEVLGERDARLTPFHPGNTARAC